MNSLSKKNIFTIALSFLMGATSWAQFTQEAKVISTDRGSRDEYGSATDIRDDYAVAGAWRYNIAAGAAYIYAKDVNGDWTHHQTLIPDDAKEMAEFGGAVKMTEDYIVVASGRADTGNEIRTGALYVYDRSTTNTWEFNSKLIASDYSGEAKLGMNNTTLDAQGNFIVAGAPGDNGWIGSVYIFEEQGGSWSEIQKIENPKAPTNDSFGIAVAMDGNMLAIGANETFGTKGMVYMYEKQSNGQWTLQQELTASDGLAQDFFGTSVSIHENTLAIGAYGVENETGAVYIFKRDGNGEWNETQKLIASTADVLSTFGWQCEVHLNTLVVGAPHSWGPTEGEAFIFQEDGNGVWQEIQIVQSNDIASEDFFGWAVSIYKDQIMVGAPWEDHDENGNNEIDRAGASYIFKDPTLLEIKQLEHTENSLTLYPNPSKDYIALESLKTIAGLQLYSTNGRLLKDVKLKGTKKHQIDLSAYTPGMYMIQVLFDDSSPNYSKIIKTE